MDHSICAVASFLDSAGVAYAVHESYITPPIFTKMLKLADPAGPHHDGWLVKREGDTLYFIAPTTHGFGLICYDIPTKLGKSITSGLLETAVRAWRKIDPAKVDLLYQKAVAELGQASKPAIV